MSAWARIHAAKHRERNHEETTMAKPSIDHAFELSDAIAYGWDAGKERAFQALLPYVRHHNGCGAVGCDDPRDDRCSCGLRRVWRIRETD